MNKKDLLLKYSDYLTLKNYSTGTKKSYKYALNKFLEYCQSHTGMHNDILSYAKSYLVYRFDSGKSWRTVNIDYACIRNLCTYILRLEWDYTMIPRPRTETRLPNLLSGQQVELMINLTKNLKHKTILILLYTSGIRKGELIDLRISDVLNIRRLLGTIYQ